MLNCDFCKITNYKNLELAQGVILYEDELLVIFPARGAPVPGYLMIITKKHINSFAELTKQELLHVESVVANIMQLYRKYFNVNSILLEHGSTKNGRHPQSIVHAHLHLIPFNFNNAIEDELIQKLRLKKIFNYQDIRSGAGLDYWFYRSPEGEYYFSTNVLDAPRSIFMNLIANQIGLATPYEWRNSKTKDDYVHEMKQIFEKFACL